MNGAPKKGIDDSSNKGESSNNQIRDIDNKFGDDIQNNSQSEHQDFNSNLKTPTPNNQDKLLRKNRDAAM